MIGSLAIASDHGGYTYKAAIIAFLHQHYPDITVLDYGPAEDISVDYPDYAQTVCKAIQQEKVNAGIVICGSGIGISIAANRHSGIRAALCTNKTMACLTRAHNDANVLALGQRIIGLEVAFDCVRAFLETEFQAGRHVSRIQKIENFEQ